MSACLLFWVVTTASMPYRLDRFLRQFFWQRERDAVLAASVAYAELDGPSPVKEPDGVTE